jgi:PAS domain S-box-containing protein
MNEKMKAAWTWDISANKIEWTAELYEMFGLKPQEFEASYEAYLQALHPDDREKVNLVVQNAFRDHTPFEIEHRVQWPDGTIKWIKGVGKVELNENGEAITMIGSAEDISDRKQEK